MCPVPRRRTAPRPQLYPGTHLLRGHAAHALRAYGAYVRLPEGHRLRASYGRLFDAVAERMQAAGNAHHLAVEDLAAAYKRAKLDADGFLLRVDDEGDGARVLPPFKAKMFVGGLVQQAGLYNRPAKQKKVDPGPRNQAIYARVWTYARKDLACTSLPEMLVEELRAEHSFYVNAADGRSLGARKAECRRLLQAQGYFKVKYAISAEHGTRKSYLRLFAAALELYTEQNDYLSVGDIQRLARETGHDMRVSAEQKLTVEAAMRSLFTSSRNYQYQQYQQENKMRFALEKAIYTGNKNTLNKGDLIKAMATAELPRTSRKLCQMMLPKGELSATDLAGIAGTRT